MENALFEARAARDAAEAARDDLAQRVEEMEEDVEAEREWRESAQKQAARLAKQADAAAAAADREEATAQNLRRALETLRQENEAAEATRKEEAERRRTGAARRVRDRQTSEHREKEALRAKVQSLEHDLEKANQRLDDMPRMQSEIRRLKVRRGKHRFELIFLDGTQNLTGILCFFVFCFSFNPQGIKSEARSTAAAKATACRGKIIADLSDTRAGTDYAKHDRDHGPGRRASAVAEKVCQKGCGPHARDVGPSSSAVGRTMRRRHRLRPSANVTDLSGENRNDTVIYLD